MLADHCEAGTHVAHHTGSLSRVKLFLCSVKHDLYAQNLIAILIVSGGDVDVSNPGIAENLFENARMIPFSS